MHCRKFFGHQRYSGFMLAFCFIVNGYASTSTKAIIVKGQDFSISLSEGILYKLVNQQWEQPNFIVDSGWVANSGNALNLGMTKKGVWLKVGISNPMGFPLYFVLESTFIDYAALYWSQSDSMILLDEDGLLLNKKKKDSFQILSHQSNLPENSTYYIYVVSDMGITTPIELYAESSYNDNYEQRLGVFALLTGLFGIIFLFNFFLFLSLRDMVYLFYGLYVIMTYCTQIITSSLGYSFFGLNILWMDGNMIFLTVSAVAFFTGIFLYFFYRSDLEKLKNLDAVKYLMIALSIGGISIYFVSIIATRSVSFKYMNFGMLLLTVLCFYINAKLFLNGVKRAKFILIAWSVFLIGAILFMLSNANILPYSFLTQYTMPIGASLETVLLSFALGFRIKGLEEERKQNEITIIEQETKNQHLELESTKTQLTALRSQMNPHFIFNALNTIHSSLLDDDQAKADKLLVGFAKLMRKILEHSRSEKISLSEEVDFLENYMDLEQLKNGTLFKTEFFVDEELLQDDPLIPPTMIQPVCENAVKHAFKHNLQNKNLITIWFQKSDDLNIIKVTVKDNGVGFENPELVLKSRSQGLSIIQERLGFLKRKYEVSALTIDSITGEGLHTGTKVTVHLPML